MSALYEDCWTTGPGVYTDAGYIRDAGCTAQPDSFAIPKGGTPLDDIRDTANSMATLTIGGSVQEPGAGDYLEKDSVLRTKALPLPISLEFTDHLVASLEELTRVAMPDRYEQERGRLLDTMIDAHKLLADVKTAVYGDTEMVLGITRFMGELA